MIALTDKSKLTPEEYLAAEEQSPVKHEYIDGEVYAMAGTTDNHNTIALNLATLIHNHFKGTDCRVYFSDVKAKIAAKNRFYYPDLLVTCDVRDRETSTYKSFPKLIIEVLSDSTEKFDRGDKFNDYQALASLEEYVLVSSQHQRVEIFRRKHQFWQYQTYDLDQPNFKLETIGLDVKIADIYEDVVLESMSENSIP
ncbi:Uma2 family endonuclease [Spirulina sp. CCNP1310]|uniref:Uma2 family endonuclease n=1 Tax=Spirulina sp. CCNP1310 TaxID=3110249 RepID=UPI002B21CCBC|nr:Uma2 family endonuclease [Spirulina sp. CCNP1310]MEA5420711.1 Uma2 family endonuclease [Spirulina sp. CCNP1310]